MPITEINEIDIEELDVTSNGWLDTITLPSGIAIEITHDKLELLDPDGVAHCSYAIEIHAQLELESYSPRLTHIHTLFECSGDLMIQLTSGHLFRVDFDSLSIEEE